MQQGRRSLQVTAMLWEPEIAPIQSPIPSFAFVWNLKAGITIFYGEHRRALYFTDKVGLPRLRLTPAT